MELSTLQTVILSLSDSDKIQIINEFEQFEKDGCIGECLLRQTAKTLPMSQHYITLYMNKIANECYRYFANSLFKTKALKDFEFDFTNKLIDFDKLAIENINGESFGVANSATYIATYTSRFEEEKNK